MHNQILLKKNRKTNYDIILYSYTIEYKMSPRVAVERRGFEIKLNFLIGLIPEFIREYYCY